MVRLAKFATGRNAANVGLVYGAGDARRNITGAGSLESTLAQIGTTKYLKVSGGINNYLLIKKSDNTLWGCAGYTYNTGNEYGQLGLGYTSTSQIPLLQLNLNTWREVSCGPLTSFAIATDGTLWGCGYNGNGQLGQGDTTDRYSFTQIGTDSDWVSIAAGNNVLLAIKSDGTLWFAGDSYPIGSAGSNTTTLTQIGVALWSKVSCGTGFAMAIKTDGTLWGVGTNGVGQLGLGDTTARTSFTKVTTATYSQVSCGVTCTMAIKTTGILCGCGANTYGQLGFGDTTQRTTLTPNGSTVWSYVRCSKYTTTSVMLIKSDGTLWGCGYNNGGQLGNGSVTSQFSTITQSSALKFSAAVPTQICTIALRSN